MRRQWAARWFALFGGFVALVGVNASVVGSTEAAAQSDRQRVLVAEIDGAITPVMSAHVDGAISHAERERYHALVLQMDTPGGLDTAMREIVQDILDAAVPVVVYVAPQGARAASAGAIITFASHVAAMAPGTAIGAATPVGGGGENLEAKATNDAAAYAESLARFRNRDVDFAIEAVRSGRSISADEALRLGVIETIAPSLDELLESIDGRSVSVGPASTTVVLATRGAIVESYEMGIFRRIQQFLADPNLAFLLLSLGTLGLIFELTTPGLGAGAIVALVSFTLAAVGLAVLPVNAVGVVFVVLGALLFAAEIFTPGFGVAAVGGGIMLLLGGVYLVDDAPGLEVSVSAVLPIVISVAVLCVVAGRLALRSRTAASNLSGSGVLIGQTVTIRVNGGRPLAFVEGAWWRARLPDGVLADGDVARVKSISGLELIVERIEPEAHDRSPTISE